MLHEYSITPTLCRRLSADTDHGSKIFEAHPSEISMLPVRRLSVATFSAGWAFSIEIYLNLCAWHPQCKDGIKRQDLVKTFWFEDTTSYQDLIVVPMYCACQDIMPDANDCSLHEADALFYILVLVDVTYEAIIADIQNSTVQADGVQLSTLWDVAHEAYSKASLRVRVCLDLDLEVR